MGCLLLFSFRCWAGGSKFVGFFFNLQTRLEEDGVLTDCNMKTLEPDDVLDFDFCSSNVINKIIMKVRGACGNIKKALITIFLRLQYIFW